MSGDITSSYNTGISLGSSNYPSPLTIATTGRVSNPGTGGAIYGSAGTLLNYGGITAGGGSSLHDFGVYLSGAGSVDNVGTIVSDGAGIAIYGAAYVSNSGTISGARNGVALLAGGYVANSGTGVISATGTNTGVYIGGGAGTVVNSATIEGGTGVAFYAAGIANQTLIDSGTIIGTGGTAVAFGAGDNLLQLQPGNLLLRGTAGGGGGVNTLEFASAAGAGTLTGVGAYFDNFANGAVYAGATWTLAGSNTIASSVTLTNSGYLTLDGTFVNGGHLSGNQLDLAGVQLTNLSSGFVYGSRYGVYAASGGPADTLVNQGTIVGLDIAIDLISQGNITNAAGGSIYGFAGGVILAGTGATVVNLGTIAAPTGGAAGVEQRSGGVVANGASGATAALIQGYAAGVESTGTYSAQVSNYGTIEAMRFARGAYGIVIQGAGTVSNLGTAALIEGEGGISIALAGTVSNAGTIVALPAGYAAVAIQGAGYVGNLGAASLIEGYGGVSIGGTGTVGNAGTIAATALSGSYFGVAMQARDMSATSARLR